MSSVPSPNLRSSSRVKGSIQCALPGRASQIDSFPVVIDRALDDLVALILNIH